MLQIAAAAIGEPLASCLVDGAESSVVARFDSTVQLENADGLLWAITSHPNAGAMRIVAPIVPRLTRGQVVGVRNQQVVADDFVLGWDEAARFDPIPRCRTLSALDRRRVASCIANAIARWQLPEAHGLWDDFSEIWTPLSVALDDRNSESLDPLVQHMIGRGPGLTPTADDFLQALLVTLGSDESDRSSFEALARAVASRLSRTTRTSRAFLQEALRGWAFGPLKEVLDTLPTVTQDGIRALLSVGATSGPAYALGILMGLVYTLDHESANMYRMPRSTQPET